MVIGGSGTRSHLPGAHLKTGASAADSGNMAAALARVRPGSFQS
jgi:hypothetical protein